MQSSSQELSGISKTVASYLEMSTRPVGVKVFLQGDKIDGLGLALPQEKKTFCRFVREAALGQDFFIQMDSLSCLNAEVTLGFREPTYVNIEPRIKKKTAALRIGPVEDCDVVLLVLTPEQIMIMSILLQGANAKFKGEMGVCGEAMAQVYESGAPNVTFLCNGARINGGYEPIELIMGLPYQVFLELPSKMTKFASLSKKARDSFAQLLLRLR